MVSDYSMLNDCSHLMLVFFYFLYFSYTARTDHPALSDAESGAELLSAVDMLFPGAEVRATRVVCLILSLVSILFFILFFFFFDNFAAKPQAVVILLRRTDSLLPLPTFFSSFFLNPYYFSSFSRQRKLRGTLPSSSRPSSASTLTARSWRCRRRRMRPPRAVRPTSVV